MEQIGTLTPRDGDIDTQAERWLVTLSSGQVTEAQLREFALWLAEGSEHRETFDRVQEDWKTLGVVAHLPLPVPRASSRRRYYWLAAAASIALAAVLLPLWQAGETAVYQSAIGEQKEVNLADGSHITLNTNTRLTVSYTRDARSIELHQGEAFFEVAKDSSRPFTVQACATEARALGTAFNVRCEWERGSVTVTEGTVQVSQTSASNDTGDKQVLTGGQQVKTSSEREPTPAASVDTAEATSWLDGALVFHNTSLREVIDEISRYTPQTILIGSSRLADTPLSGRIDIADTAHIIAALQKNFPLAVETLADGSLLLNALPQ